MKIWAEELRRDKKRKKNYDALIELVIESSSIDDTHIALKLND